MLETTLTVDNFEEEVLNQEGYVLVDFWATWCGPCKMIAPIVAEIAEENQGTIKVGKVDVDQQMPLAQKYRVASIPTLIRSRMVSRYSRASDFPRRKRLRRCGNKIV